jgi:hypothetical protein
MMWIFFQIYDINKKKPFKLQNSIQMNDLEIYRLAT